MFYNHINVLRHFLDSRYLEFINIHVFEKSSVTEIFKLIEISHLPIDQNFDFNFEDNFLNFFLKIFWRILLYSK